MIHRPDRETALETAESMQGRIAPEGGQTGTVRTRLDALVAWTGTAVAWLIFLAMGISVVEVFLRYLFNAPTSWVHETTIFLIAAIFAWGGPVALARDRHIRVRIIYDAVSPRVRRWLDVLNGAIGLLFTLGMSYAAYTLFWRASHNPQGAWQLERSGTSWNPPFPAITKGLIMLAVAVMTLQTVLHLIQALRGAPAHRQDRR